MGDYIKDTKTWKVGSQELYVAYKEYCKDSGHILSQYLTSIIV